MVGKIRGVTPTDGALRIPGVLHRYWRPELQKWVTKAWPKGNGGDTPARKAAREEFKAIVQGIKYAPASQVAAALQMTQNTPWLVRDWLMMSAVGKGVTLITLDGKTWDGVRILYPQIQALLNSISGTIGGMLVRADIGWVVLTPVGTTPGQVLTSNGPGLTPDYQDPPPSGVQTVDPDDGIAASITGTELEIGIAPLAAHEIMANITAGSAVPVGNSLSAVLDLISSTTGALLYRDVSGWVALNIGTAGQILASDGTSPSWQTPGGSGAPTEPSLGDMLTVPAHPGFDANMVYAASITISNNNKDAQPASSSPYNYAYGNVARYTGKRYFEFNPASVSFEAIGFCGAHGHAVDIDAGSPGNFGERWMGQIGWTSGGAVKAMEYDGGGVVTLATYATWAATNRLSFALDIDNRLAWFRVTSGNWNNSGAANPATGAGGLFVPQLFSGAANRLVWPGCNMGNTSKSSMYLLAADFTQSVPSGFTGWGN